MAKDLVINKKYKDAKLVAEDTIKLSQQLGPFIEQSR